MHLPSIARFGLNSLLAAVVGLTLPCVIQAQTKAPAAKAAEANVKFSEAETLRQAYIVLAAANHDYNGHRAKAMGHIQAAVKTLDKAVSKNGSNQAKAASAYQDAVAAAAKRAAKGAPMIHEAQSVSDLQLKKAAQALIAVRPALVQLKQKGVLSQVDNAIKELNIALEIR